MDRLSMPERTRAALDDVQRERVPVVVRSQDERCARGRDGPRQRAVPEARVEGRVGLGRREEDDVERGEARVGAYEPRAACAERIIAGRRYDAQDQGAELAERPDGVREGLLQYGDDDRQWFVKHRAVALLW